VCEMLYQEIIPNITDGKHPLSTIYITQAVCKEIDSRVIRRVPLKDTVESDIALSEKYPPLCRACQVKGKEIIHPTERSYFLFIPSDLDKYFSDIDEITNTIAGWKGQRDRASNWRSARDLQHIIADGYELRAQHEMQLRNELSIRSAHFVTMRVKHTARIVDKVLRNYVKSLMTMNPNDTGERALETTQITDLYGARLIVPTQAKARAFLENLAHVWKKRYGPQSLVYAKKIRDDKLARGDAHVHKCGEYLIRTEKTHHHSVKIYLPYKDITVETMAMTPLHMWDDRQDHLSYEHRRRALLEDARKQGIPVDKMKNALERIFQKCI
jgi:hypothetical protein